jgi:NACHT domain/Effector-associated domain 8
MAGTGETLITRISRMLAPHTRSENEQRNLVDAALYGFDALRTQIIIGQAGDAFAIACASQLLTHGSLPDGTHPLVRLLETQRDKLGEGAWAEWNLLIADVQQYLHLAPLSTAQRSAELAYLRYLRARADWRYDLTENDATYVDLAGISEEHVPAPRPHRRAKLVRAVGPEFVLEQQRDERAPEMRTESKPFPDAVAKILELRQAALLGEPGAGKSTVMVALARALMADALTDASAPLPVLVDLARWLDAGESLRDFIASQLGSHAALLAAWLTAGRAALLLDSLNEIPSSQREAKYAQLQSLFTELKTAHPRMILAVSCRAHDYPDLGFGKIQIQPLDALRVRRFAAAYLGEADGEALFWKLAGAAARAAEDECERAWAANREDWREVLWLHKTLPAGFEWGYFGSFWRWESWLAHRDEARGLLQLARNPYLLDKLIDEFVDGAGDLPANRGQLSALSSA